MRALELSGKRFGRLTVIGRVVSKPGTALWNCLCECGRIKYVISSHLSNGTVKSCGCLVLKHGHASGGRRTRTYRVWESMLRRCVTMTHPAYADYGGRGITVCNAWFKFENFLLDMGVQPKGMTLDRENNNKGYSPDNCRWATWKTQNRNKRGVRLIFLDGKTKTIAEWSEQKDWPHYVIASRLREGWNAEAAINTPWRRRGT